MDNMLWEKRTIWSCNFDQHRFAVYIEKTNHTDYLWRIEQYLYREKRVLTEGISKSLLGAKSDIKFFLKSIQEQTGRSTFSIMDFE